MPKLLSVAVISIPDTVHGSFISGSRSCCYPFIVDPV
jgi:hypothetical protein